MNKRKILGIVSFLMIILLSVLFCENRHNFLLGGFILKKMGVRVWSNGNSGLYYPGVIAAILIILGIVGIIQFKEDVYRNFGKFVVLFFIVWSIIYQPTYDLAYGFVRSNLNGLRSIEYIKDSSWINFTSHGEEILFNGKIRLKNYSSDKKEFYIKLPVVKDEMAVNPQFIPVTNTKKKPTQYVISPNKQVDLDINFSIQEQKSAWQNGNLISPDIIIYNETEEIHEGKR
ncbi:hypothetical protein [Ruminiclostridium papyrosolvens]|uniref:Uncharacterized protein n=1 Tax=Ruminiclostridium papyrosolvens C7 TaxID=1330534 RepID=U4R145_9FIRM|nr:hypothetical protein [Ruminiclostridium papyrosolvens]EPR10493.1 hypothetical protein L323_12780 [Ruminiclostridium papyrosolvens C7]